MIFGIIIIKSCQFIFSNVIMQLRWANCRQIKIQVLPRYIKQKCKHFLDPFCPNLSKLLLFKLGSHGSLMIQLSGQSSSKSLSVDDARLDGIVTNTSEYSFQWFSSL